MKTTHNLRISMPNFPISVQAPSDDEPVFIIPDTPLRIAMRERLAAFHADKTEYKEIEFPLAIALSPETGLTGFYVRAKNVTELSQALLAVLNRKPYVTF